MDNLLPNTTFGIHWFNGSNLTKKYLNNLDSRLQNNFKVNCFLDKYVYKYAMRNRIALFCVGFDYRDGELAC